MQVCKKVCAVEVDSRMVVELRKRFSGSEAGTRLQVIHADFLKQELPYFDACVANVPYQISSPIVFKLLAQRPAPRCCVLMFQREFAMRLVARPGDDLYCRLSVNTQLLSKVEHVMKVGRNNFRPPPKVESSIVRITPLAKPVAVDFTEWDGLVRLLFNRKNKTVGALFGSKSTLEMMTQNYKTYCALQNVVVPADLDMKKMIQEVISSSGFEGVRPAKMDIDDFMRLLAVNSELTAPISP